jgi:hypothetical protein
VIVVPQAADHWLLTLLSGCFYLIFCSMLGTGTSRAAARGGGRAQLRCWWGESHLARLI